jgi:hypothetical protein
VQAHQQQQTAVLAPAEAVCGNRVVASAVT